MRLLLINNNPAVSRLLKLSVDKAGYEMDEFEDYGLVPLKSYDVVMVDNELYDEEELSALKEQVHCDYFLYICQRGAVKPDFVNVVLEKPFLPTDFLTLLEKIKNVVNSFKAEDPKEEALPEEEEPQGFTEMGAFDIGDMEVDDDKEGDKEGDLSLDFEEDKEEEEDIFAEIKGEASLEDELPTFDLDSKDEDLELSFAQEKSADLDEELLETFDFEEEKKEESENEAEEVNTFEEISTSILDKDDINEVKQLLEENDEDEENADDFALSLEEKEDEEKELFHFDTESSLEEDEALSLDEEVEISENEVDLSSEEEMEEETLLDTQEEIIDDFAEEIEEKIEKESEEQLFAEVDVALQSEESSGIDSLDDLNENLLKKAFGEEVDEEKVLPSQNNTQIEVIRDEIENSIARSISGFAQSDVLREALKGMKINISITFDEKS